MSEKPKNTDILLQIFVSAKGEPISPVQLQKVAFLVGDQCKDEELPEDYYEFKPYDYGPFNSQIYSDAEELAAQGLVLIDLDSSGTRRQYRATFKSRDEDMTAISQGVRNYIEQAVDWATSLTFRQLVSSIYEHYPQYKVNSVFRV